MPCEDKVAELWWRSEVGKGKFKGDPELTIWEGATHPWVSASHLGTFRDSPEYAPALYNTSVLIDNNPEPCWPECEFQVSDPYTNGRLANFNFHKRLLISTLLVHSLIRHAIFFHSSLSLKLMKAYWVIHLLQKTYPTIDIDCAIFNLFDHTSGVSLGLCDHGSSSHEHRDVTKRALVSALIHTRCSK